MLVSWLTSCTGSGPVLTFMMADSESNKAKCVILVWVVLGDGMQKLKNLKYFYQEFEIIFW